MRQRAILMTSLLKRSAEAAARFEARPELLLMPNVPKPLHGVAPRVVLGAKWWEKTRREAYASTGQRCAACGVPKRSALFHPWLEAHEVYEIRYSTGRATYVETVPLCHACHNFIHDGRLWALMKKGEVTVEKFELVMEHGLRVLSAAGLKKPSAATFDGKPVMHVSKIAEWSKWRMVIFGKQFKPKYKNFDEWLIAHGHAE